MTSLMTLTDAAVKHIQTMLEKNPQGKGFRLSIKKTGCSGYAYLPTIVEKINAEDIHFVAQQHLSVYIDKNCLDLLKGLIIDYVADDNNSLKQKRLVFINPNEKNRCGCGESFNV